MKFKPEHFPKGGAVRKDDSKNPQSIKDSLNEVREIARKDKASLEKMAEKDRAIFEKEIPAIEKMAEEDLKNILGSDGFI